MMMAMTLAERVNEQDGDRVIQEISDYFDGTADAETMALDRESFLEIESEKLHRADNVSVLVITGLFGISLVVMLVNYSSMKKWEQKTADERDQARIVAFTDPLTGVKSKHAYTIQEELMGGEIAEGKAGEFAVIVCDVNGLKKINDTLGHKAGDEYIRAACNMLCEYFKHSPVYRVGGDEFVVLLQGRDFDTRHEIMRDINEKIEANIGEEKVVMSLGLSVFDPENDKTFHEVFKRADGLMYERKTQLKKMGAVTRE
jgi:diguanylate cyclase (GGDEF)-like protein